MSEKTWHIRTDKHELTNNLQARLVVGARAIACLDVALKLRIALLVLRFHRAGTKMDWRISMHFLVDKLRQLHYRLAELHSRHGRRDV